MIGKRIEAALEELKTGGSTLGAAGLELAFEITGKFFIKDGINRIISRTDWDFNLGPSSDQAMKKIEIKELQLLKRGKILEGS